MISIETPKGAIIYANDFKLDDTPVLGLKPNYKRLREIAKDGVLAFVVDSLYSGSERKTPSEKIARELNDGDLTILLNCLFSFFKKKIKDVSLNHRKELYT